MAANPSFSRASAERSTADEFQFSEFPEIPVSMLNRFPELRPWEASVKVWNEQNSRRLRDALTALKGR